MQSGQSGVVLPSSGWWQNGAAACTKTKPPQVVLPPVTHPRVSELCCPVYQGQWS